MTYVEKVPNALQDSACSPMNDARTCEPIGTGLTQPRSLSDLRSFLRGYVIKAGGEGKEPRRLRAANLVGLIDTLPAAASADHAYAVAQMMRQQAAELAILDSSLTWISHWKPRVAVNAGSDR